MSRISSVFNELRGARKRGFIPFLVAGDPDLDNTAKLLIELGQQGATVIELGIPFSDPMADGPVIQRASERALKHGFGLQDVFETVRRVRSSVATPIVLFSYYNPLMQFGLERLARESKAAGIDGFLVTDLIPEEARDFREILAASSLDLIFLVAPTSSDARLQLVADQASGFIYAVSRAGVTGMRERLSQEAEILVNRVRTFTNLPVAVGFGISTREQVADVWSYADAAVVGSAIVSRIETCHANDLASAIGEYVSGLIPESL
ncbi:MAG TPA: tryptophan synthase subunit alpha [Pyrinomonadaceae bacterium]|nr:tryptophan synthase subunit alpha [Pyrinomonadaceae bacterium]